jgi:hypothetical protein
MKDAPAASDPASFEIVKNSLFKIAEEMRVVLCKTAYSPILKSAGDFSCGVFDRKGNMVAQGPDLPIHLGSMPDAVRAIVAAFGADAAEGDVFIQLRRGQRNLRRGPASAAAAAGGARGDERGSGKNHPSQRTHAG